MLKDDLSYACGVRECCILATALYIDVQTPSDKLIQSNNTPVD